MDLQQFITTTLVQIANGMREAQAQLMSTGAQINPPDIRDSKSQTRYGYIDAKRESGVLTHVEGIVFDVALTASKDAQAGGGLKVYVAEVGGKMSEHNSSESRVKFIIPMVYPRCH